MRVLEILDSYRSALESDYLDFSMRSYAQNTRPISETPIHL